MKNVQNPELHGWEKLLLLLVIGMFVTERNDAYYWFWIGPDEEYNYFKF